MGHCVVRISKWMLMAIRPSISSNVNFRFPHIQAIHSIIPQSATITGRRPAVNAVTVNCDIIIYSCVCVMVYYNWVNAILYVRVFSDVLLFMLHVTNYITTVLYWNIKIEIETVGIDYAENEASLGCLVQQWSYNTGCPKKWCTQAF